MKGRKVDGITFVGVKCNVILLRKRRRRKNIVLFVGKWIWLKEIEWEERSPPGKKEKVKKLGEGLTAHKSPIGSTNNQWG
ncbi:hypothetical protein BKK40_24730 [Bacillus cereus]|nr:hypothetical protein BKK40_24730 [Bacillus cereus]